MTTPSVPVSPGYPLLQGPAQDAIAAARSRIDAVMRPQSGMPLRLTREEREEALKDAEERGACLFCGGFHYGPSTPACPRLATFRLDGDGKVVEGSFFPSGGFEEIATADPDGKVAVTRREFGEWDTSRVTFAADVAEEDEDGEDDAGTGP